MRRSSPMVVTGPWPERTWVSSGRLSSSRWIEASEARDWGLVNYVVGDDALHAVRALRATVHGFATLEIAGGFGLPLDCDESFRRLVQVLILGMQQVEMV